MMQTEIIEQTVDRQLADVGIKRDFEEQAVRLMFFHLFCAIRCYRDMTYAEKNTAGYWYRKKFKNDYSLTGFFKERKRKRDKKKSPLHPSYKEESGVVEKDEKITKKEGVDFGAALKAKQDAFWRTLLPYKEKYGQPMLERFQAYWAAPVNGTLTLLWETKETWSVSYRLKSWSKSPIELDAQNAEIRLERTKKKTAKAAVNTENSEAQKAIAAEREAADAQREEATANAKAVSITMEEYLKKNPNSILRTLKKHD